MRACDARFKESLQHCRFDREILVHPLLAQSIVMESSQRQRLIDQAKLLSDAEPQPQFIVFTDRERLTESAAFHKQIAPADHRRHMHEALAKQVLRNPSAVAGFRPSLYPVSLWV